MSRVSDLLRQAAEHAPDKVALVGDDRVTYRQLLLRTRQLASALRARGVGPGDRVAIFMSNTIDAAIAFWAILEADAVVVPINALTKSDKLSRLLGHCGAAALVTEQRLANIWRSARLPPVVCVAGETLPEPSDPSSETSAKPDALALIMYTSGSTGNTKGVMLSHRNVTSAAASISSYLQLDHDDVIHGFMPLSFDYGLYQLIMSVRQAATLVLAPSFALPAQVLKQAAAERVTVFPGVPTVFSMLDELRTSSWDLSAVRTVTSTAATLTEKHIATIRRIFPEARIFSMYGLTECKRCTYLPPDDLERKPHSVGIAIPGTELWLVDKSGRRLGHDEVGELVIRGPTVMLGYWNDPEATAASLRPGPDPGERVLYTGDLCRLDADGYLYFVARTDDIIKSRGEKVAPKEVETVIAGIEGVHEVAVIGIPDEVVGEAIVAFVVADEAVTEAAMIRACRDRLEAYMVPRSIMIVAELPRSPNGKIDRRSLRGRM
jgi:amino acid adenylation domain-containing protein